jgi:hypothetical protein
MLHKKPSRTKGCNCCTLPIYAIFLILTLVFFIPTIGLSEVCTHVLEGSSSSILPASFQNTASMIVSVKDNCYKNVSILQSAIQLKLVDPEMTNLTKISQDQINAVDFTKISEGFNLSTMIDLSDSPTDRLETLTKLDLSGMDITPLTNVHLNILPQLRSQLETISDSLTNVKGNATEFMLTFDPPTVSAPLQVKAVDDLKDRIDVINAMIAGILLANTGDLDRFDADVVSITSSITSLNSTANELISFGNTIPIIYDDAIKSLTTFANDASSNVHEIKSANKCNPCC